jgi:hypothetical protein
MANRQREDTVLEAKRSKTKPPPMFKVLLLNDDYTPMDFVAVLQRFSLSRSGDPGHAQGSPRRHGCLRYIPEGCCGNQSRAGKVVRQAASTPVTVRNGRKLINRP